MDQRLKVLKILSGIGDRNWKVGKSNSYINAVTARASALPSSVFDRFSINLDPSKQISVVDFVLLTYNMKKEDKENLMDVYGIDHKTVISILRTAEDIAEEIGIER